MSLATAAPITIPVSTATRWTQLLLGLICMMAISSPQYVWALFTKPLGTALNAPAAAIQVTFSILVVLQTFFSPFQGWLVERFGPRTLIGLGGALTGLSWILAAQVSTLTGLYLTYGLLGGLGTGIVYVGVVGQVVGWFPERRGFAAGTVAAGYGMGAIVTTFPISNGLTSDGFAPTLVKWGLILGVIGVIAALGLRSPPVRRLAEVAAPGAGRDVPTTAMLRTPIFWLMLVMMALMSTTGLMVVSQIGQFAADYGITKMTVMGAAALPLALSIDRFFNGLTRPFFGWVSDHLGRENTMALAFGLEALAMATWIALIDHPLAFVLMSGLVFFGWGEIFSLFPSTLTDTFGTRYATTNYGCLYIAQGIGAILGGPLASLLHAAAGGWVPVFAVAIACDLLTAILALAVLKPLRTRYLA
jgi:MFS transporter, OFA family, oxalate/formate antiporter